MFFWNLGKIFILNYAPSSFSINVKPIEIFSIKKNLNTIWILFTHLHQSKVGFCLVATNYEEDGTNYSRYCERKSVEGIKSFSGTHPHNPVNSGQNDCSLHCSNSVWISPTIKLYWVRYRSRIKILSYLIVSANIVKHIVSLKKPNIAVS